MKVATLASSSTPSASTTAMPFVVITSTTICEAFPEVRSAMTRTIIDKALECKVLLALPAPHDTLAPATTNLEDAREHQHVLTASAGSCWTLCSCDNVNKRITHGSLGPQFVRILLWMGALMLAVCCAHCHGRIFRVKETASI
jgi:hypothetical protein